MKIVYKTIKTEELKCTTNSYVYKKFFKIVSIANDVVLVTDTTVVCIITLFGIGNIIESLSIERERRMC